MKTNTKEVMCKMWSLIVCFNFVSVWSLVTAVLLYVYNTEGRNCILFDNTVAENLHTIISRSLAYVIWLVPIIYVFWPADKCCC